MAWDVLSGAAKMAWDVLSGVTKTAWDVLSGVTNRCGMFCPGWQKMAWDVLSRDVLSYIHLQHIWNPSFLKFPAAVQRITRDMADCFPLQLLTYVEVDMECY